MFCRAVGTFAALIVAADSFLLPPGISSVNSHGSVSTAVDAKTQSIKLPCPDCIFPSKDDDKSFEAEKGDDLVWIQGGRARDVVLSFTLSDDFRAIMVNDWQMYPITMDTPDHLTVLGAAASASLVDVKQNPEKATTLEVSAASISVNEEPLSPMGDKVVDLSVQILSLEGQPISVDGVEVKLLQQGDGTLMFISLEGVPKANSVFESSPHPPPPTHAPAKDCNSMLPAAVCQLKGMIESKIEGFRQGVPHKFGGKGCGGRKGPHRLPGHIRPHLEHLETPDDEEHDPNSHHAYLPRPHSRPHGTHGMHGMHGGPHHQKHHHHLHMFLRASVSVLIPVIAGITMGLFVSLVGMATGRLIALLWIKFRRGGQRGYSGLAQTEAENDVLEKGAVELAAEEPLPEYEAAPAYNEEEQK